MKHKVFKSRAAAFKPATRRAIRVGGVLDLSVTQVGEGLHAVLGDPESGREIVSLTVFDARVFDVERFLSRHSRPAPSAVGALLPALTAAWGGTHFLSPFGKGATTSARIFPSAWATERLRKLRRVLDVGTSISELSSAHDVDGDPELVCIDLDARGVPLWLPDVDGDPELVRVDLDARGIAEDL